MEEGENIKPGAVRITDDDEVEIFDGTSWRLYRNLPPGDLGTILRNDPEERYVIRETGDPRRS